MTWFNRLIFGTTAVAVVIAYSFYKLKSQISYSLDFGSVLDALVLFVVFIFIDYAYSKQSSEKRADTDLLLSMVDEAKEAFRELQTKSQCCEHAKTLSLPEQRSLTSTQRELSNAVHSMERALGHCGIDAHSLQFDKVKNDREALNESLTDTPYPGPYDAASIVRIRTASKAMRDELTRLAFAINHR
jgi:hypothetical protein